MRAVKHIILAAFAVALCALPGLLKTRLCFAGGTDRAFFCGHTSADCREVECGKFPALERLALKDVCGEKAYYPSFDLESFLNGVNGKILFTEECGDGVNYYCSANLPYSITLYGEEVNLHVFMRGDGATVGSPIIFGGY